VGTGRAIRARVDLSFLLAVRSSPVRGRQPWATRRALLRDPRSHSGRCW